MKTLIALSILTTTSFTFADSEFGYCSQERDEKIAACRVAVKRCCALRPETATICYEIYDECTFQAHQEFFDCENN